MLDYLTIIATSTLASAVIAGAGLIILSLVLNADGLAMKSLVIIAGPGQIPDMLPTCVNLSGDLMVSVLVGKSENRQS